MHDPLPLSARVVRALLKSKARGAWRAAMTMIHNLPALRRVPIAFGDWPPLYFDLRENSAQGWLIGAPYSNCPYEPEVQRTLTRFAQPGDIVVDVGANCGLHMMLLAHAVGPTGRVHAIEPNPKLVACLRLGIDRVPNTTLHACAVGERREELTLYVPEHDNGQASLADWTVGLGNRSNIRTSKVQVVPLRDLLDSQPTLMKVDVEGAEVMVFRGAREFLDRPDAPVILFEELALGEKAMGVAPHAAADFLLGLERPGYSLNILQDDGSLSPYTTEHNGWINVLAIPASRREGTRNAQQV